jgi:TolB-like protein
MPILVGAAAVLMLAVAIGIWQFYVHRPSVELVSKEKMPSIAVLPFNNLSDDPKQEYFADGMTGELITDLSKISGLLVISRNSSFTYKGKTVKVQQVADELKVQYVLEGSIQRAGDRVRIRAQLIDGATDHHLWAESYDAVMENIFDLQDEITKKIAAVLAVKLTVKEQNRFAYKKTINIEAYDTFVKGWEHLHRVTPDDLDQAISYFKQAIELDPNYSRAHAALAWAYFRSSLGFEFQKQIAVTESKLRLMARKYLELAMRKPTSAAHLVSSKMALFRRRYEDAINHAQLALAFDSNDTDANLNMAKVLIYTGMPKEALEFVNKTIQLDPRNMAEPLYTAGMAYFFMNDLHKAATMIERALKHNPTMLGRYDLLAATYALLGRDQDSEAAYNKYLKIWGWASGAPDLTMLMNSFPLKDRKLADRLAEGLLKAGSPGEPSGFYKISEEYRLTGEEIASFAANKEITVHGRRETFWVNHNKNGKTLYRGRKAKWWIEDDRLCYQRDIGSVKDLIDCGEVYRNPDATPGSNKQYLHVKDYGVYALTAVE